VEEKTHFVCHHAAQVAEVLQRVASSEQPVQLDRLAADLSAAALSGSQGQLLEAYISCQASNSAASADTGPTAAELQQAAAATTQQAAAVLDGLVAFIHGTAFADAELRLDFLQRVLAVLQQLAAPVLELESALRQQITVGSGSSSLQDTHARSLFSELCSVFKRLLAMKNMLGWLGELTAETLTSSMVRANHEASMSNGEAVQWELQQLLLRPIESHHDELNGTIDAITRCVLSQARRLCNMQCMRKFAWGAAACEQTRFTYSLAYAGLHIFGCCGCSMKHMDLSVSISSSASAKQTNSSLLVPARSQAYQIFWPA
jgi:hypothetical protein